ncbi:hypothetical protein GCM10010513_03150 [Streptomyces glebosus]|nr:hypothetical protein GCM10010513_03150 [Streptomyces glebosus]
MSHAGARDPPHTQGTPRMETTDPHALEPGTEVLVGPVYLAGADDGRTVTEPLDHAEGWTKIIAFGTDTYFTSPCQRVRIAHPLESHYGGWTIAYAEDPLGVPDWITTFDRNTPDEVVAAFTGALVRGLESHFADYLNGGKHHTGASPAAMLAEHGWEAARDSRPHRQVSPDGHAAYRIRSGWVHEYDELLNPEKSLWRMSAGPDPISEPSWQAYFSSYTPEHLIAASAAALTDTTPVVRQAQRIPNRHRFLVDVQLPHRAKLAPCTAAALARSPHASLPGKTPVIPHAPVAGLTPAIVPATSRRQR